MDIKDGKKRVEIFCCYARRDQPLLIELKNHLKLWEHQNLITIWDDTDITPGTNWKREITQHLNTAHIILFLVSPDFLASDYCKSTEMKCAMERYDRNEVYILPIILRHCVWEEAPFGKIQALPTNVRPVISSGWHNSDEAFIDVIKGIRKVLDLLINESANRSPESSLGQSDGDVAHVPFFPNQAQKNLSISSPKELPLSPPQSVSLSIPTTSNTDQSSQLLQQPPPRGRRINLSTRSIVGILFLIIIIGSSVIVTLRLNQGSQIVPTPISNGNSTISATSPVALTYDTAVAQHGAQFGSDAQRTHTNPSEENLSFASVQNLKRVWKAQTTGEVRSSPVVANGKVYVGSRDGYLYVFNANGCAQPCQPIWKAKTDYQIDSSPAVFHGTVYVGSDDQHLYAFDANGCGKPTCQPIWKAKTDGAVDTSPSVADGKVYVVSAGGKLYAFNTDGTPLWKPFAPPSPSSASFASSPAIDHGIIYVGATDGKLYAFKEQDCAQGSCSPLWTAQTEGEIHTAPTVIDGKIYISAGGKLYAFNITGCTQTCQLAWTAQVDSSSSSSDGPFSSPAVANGKVYIGSRDGYLYMFNANGCGKPTCNPVWTVSIGDSIQSSPTVAKDVVYVGSNGGFLYALNANGCGKPTCNPDPKRTYPVNDDPENHTAKSSPTVADSGVYIGAGNSIYAFR